MKPYKSNKMKFSAMAVLSLLLFSGKKAETRKENLGDSTVTENFAQKPTTVSSNSKQENDSITSNAFPEEKVGQIIKVVDGEVLPLLVDETFTAQNQKLILKIRNYKNPVLKASIWSENSNMNVRFNQIRTPEGKFDGPFGKEISYKIPKSGDVWLIIGKNQMAEGDLYGDFSVRVE